MCFWFQQFLPTTILATFVLLIVGSRSIFSQPADNYELCEGKIRGTKHCASKEIRWYTLFSCILYTSQPTDTSKAWVTLYYKKVLKRAFFSEDIKSICWRTIWYALTKYHHYYIGMEMGEKEHCCGGWRLKGLRKT